MFEKGDYIIYGTEGVCQVTEVGTLDSAVAVKGRVYYTLIPQYSKGSKIFTPADNTKVLMRPVLTKEEAVELINDISGIDSLGIEDEKKREFEYKDAFRKCDCRELIKLIKSSYKHMQSRISEGKKVTSQDERYFNMAEDSLYGELAIAMRMDKDQVKEYVIDKMEAVN